MMQVVVVMRFTHYPLSKWHMMQVISNSNFSLVIEVIMMTWWLV